MEKNEGPFTMNKRDKYICIRRHYSVVCKYPAGEDLCLNSLLFCVFFFFFFFLIFCLGVFVCVVCRLLFHSSRELFSKLISPISLRFVYLPSCFQTSHNGWESNRKLCFHPVNSLDSIILLWLTLIQLSLFFKLTSVYRLNKPLIKSTWLTIPK